MGGTEKQHSRKRTDILVASARILRGEGGHQGGLWAGCSRNLDHHPAPQAGPKGYAGEREEPVDCAFLVPNVSLRDAGVVERRKMDELTIAIWGLLAADAFHIYWGNEPLMRTDGGVNGEHGV
ncbi:hypothetical protein DPEC_G00019280 [Dallia pectoralis]|uniref:Uncharacterized protein n=1 Tax=Dallia pectoralis TaxID=75939 RepID=A0ACC2HFP7_DALPE|nr:hypothetical protein DPEC_G00019280 [Dallia pectoralis]